MARTDSVSTLDQPLDIEFPEEMPPPARPTLKRKGKRATTPVAAMPDVPAADEEDFWITLGNFNTDQWQYLIAYLWRCEPITDRRGGGKPTSITKYGRPFDIGTIMSEWGSGIYRIDLCQTNPHTGKQSRIRQHYFSIHNPDYPPRVALGDWIEHPENAMWKHFKEKMESMQNAERIANLPPAAPAPMDPNALFNTILNGMKTLRGEQSDNGTLAAAVLQMLGTSQAQIMTLMDPSKQLDSIEALLKRIQPPPQVNAGLGALEKVLDMYRDELKELRKEAAELRLILMKPRDMLSDLAGTIPMLKELVGALGFTRGVQKAVETNEWVGVVNSLIEKASETAPLIMDEIRARREAATPPAPGAAPGVGGAAPGQPRPTWPIERPVERQRPTPAAAAPPPAAAPEAAAASTPEPVVNGHTTSEGLGGGPTQEQVDQEQRYLEQQAQRYGPIMQAAAFMMVDNFRRDLTGFDFRDWFINAHGSLTYAGLRDDLGPMRMTALCALHPTLKHVMKPAEKVLHFFQEFFTPIGQEPPEAGEPDPDEEPINVRELTGPKAS